MVLNHRRIRVRVVEVKFAGVQTKLASRTKTSARTHCSGRNRSGNGIWRERTQRTVGRTAVYMPWRASGAPPVGPERSSTPGRMPHATRIKPGRRDTNPHHSKSSGKTGCCSGTTDFFSLSRGSALRMSKASSVPL